jgi:hypothetical protein
LNCKNRQYNDGDERKFFVFCVKHFSSSLIFCFEDEGEDEFSCRNYLSAFITDVACTKVLVFGADKFLKITAFSCHPVRFPAR